MSARDSWTPGLFHCARRHKSDLSLFGQVHGKSPQEIPWMFPANSRARLHQSSNYEVLNQLSQQEAPNSLGEWGDIMYDNVVDDDDDDGDDVDDDDEDDNVAEDDVECRRMMLRMMTLRMMRLRMMTLRR